MGRLIPPPGVSVLTAVPLCAGGAFGVVLVSQNRLSLPALIGLLVLIGIASKNSILLVAYTVMDDLHTRLTRRRRRSSAV
ncbi:MAG TPA: efflux RND transporter permease subunit [Chiayiivirga sp.]|nr:efflux RND transporter permease subunit [Chiayiivirga sp.]